MCRNSIGDFGLVASASDIKTQDPLSLWVGITRRPESSYLYAVWTTMAPLSDRRCRVRFPKSVESIRVLCGTNPPSPSWKKRQCFCLTWQSTRLILPKIKFRVPRLTDRSGATVEYFRPQGVVCGRHRWTSHVRSCGCSRPHTAPDPKIPAPPKTSIKGPKRADLEAYSQHNCGLITLTNRSVHIRTPAATGTIQTG